VGGTTEELARENERLREQQRAISGVLREVAGSAGLQPLLDEIVDAAARLCHGNSGQLYLLEADLFRVAAQTADISSEAWGYSVEHPHARDRTSIVGRVGIGGDLEQIPDVLADPEYTFDHRKIGFRSLLGVPVVLDEALIGVLALTRTAPGRFDDDDVDLVRTFADQAAIAIANARLLDAIERQRAELQLASEHKSQFLANMSHELRTPLNAIIGFSEVLREQMFGALNERQVAYVEDVLAAGRHLLSLINDVLDLAKIEAGRMELELSKVALPDVLRSALSIHSERASRSGIELALTTEPEEITVTADERRVRQVVFNLVSNAVKFTPANGRVDIFARLDDRQVEIEVADTGPGIAAGDLETIFKEFEQTADGKQVEGTGLGLPLSRKLVELHGGRLWVESTPGQGSTFRFTLPV